METGIISGVLGTVTFIFVVFVGFVMAETIKNETNAGRDLISQTESMLQTQQPDRQLSIPDRWQILKALVQTLLFPNRESLQTYRQFFCQGMFFPSSIVVLHHNKRENRIKLILQTRPMPTVIAINVSDFVEHRSFEAKPTGSTICTKCEALYRSDVSATHYISESTTHGIH